MNLVAHRVGEHEWEDYAALFSTVFRSRTSAKSLRRKLLTDFGAGPGAAFLVRDGQLPVASIGAQFLRFDTGDGNQSEIVVHVPGVSALKEYRGGTAVSLVFAAAEAYAQERGCRFAYGIVHSGSLGPVTKLHGYKLAGTFDIFTTPGAGSSEMKRHTRRLTSAVGKLRRRMADFSFSSEDLVNGNFTFEDCDGRHDPAFRRGLRERGAMAVRIAGRDILVNPGAVLRVAALPVCPIAELAGILVELQSLARHWGADHVQLMIEQRHPNHLAISELLGAPRGSLFEVWKSLGDQARTLPNFRLCPAHTDHF